MSSLLRALTFLLVGLTAAACSPTVGNYFVPTAAVVNGQRIPEGQVALEMRRVVNSEDPDVAGQFAGAAGRENRLRAQREILTRLIQQAIILQEAESLGLEATKAEVDAKVAELRGRFASEQEYREALRQEGFSEEEVRRFLRNQILVDEVVEEVTQDAGASAEEISEYYNLNRAEFDLQYRASHILICQNFDEQQRTCAHTPQDEALARRIAERAKAGEDFAALAREFSRDQSSRESGGDLGYQEPGTLAPEFEQAVGALQPGEISDPVRTAFGFHVIKLVARGRSLEDATEEISGTLAGTREQEAFRDWLTEELKKARISINPKFGEFDRTTFQVVPTKLQINDGGESGQPRR